MKLWPNHVQTQRMAYGLWGYARLDLLYPYGIEYLGDERMTVCLMSYEYMRFSPFRFNDFQPI